MLNSLKYEKKLGAHANIANIQKVCVKCFRNSKFSKEETRGLHELTYKDVTRPFRFVQIDLTGKKDGYAYIFIMKCIQMKLTKILTVISRDMQ